MEYKESAVALRNIIASAQKYSENRDFTELFIDAETIVSYLAYLITPKIELEQAYRQEIVANLDKGLSNAESEARARAGDTYKEWKKLEHLYELAEEQIKVIKKFETNLGMEYRRS